MCSTKDKIISVVSEMLINNINYEDISMTKVAEKVGIGKSTIYEHFASKNDLLLLATINLADYILSNTRKYDITTFSFKEAFEKQILSILDMNIYRSFAFNFFKNNHSYLKDKQEIIEQVLTDLTNDLTSRFELIFEKGFNENIINKEKFNNNSIVVRNLIVGTIICNNDKDNMSEIEVVNKLYETLIVILK